ncbi:hypothetical protein [Lysobacter sp. HA35]
MKRLLLIALPCLLAACVPDNLASLETVAPSTLTSAAPWQDAYRTINVQMHACADVGGFVASSIDGQLYNDRGEIILTYQQNPVSSTTGPILQLLVKPATTGSLVEVRQAKNPLASQVAAMIPRWLQGETACR